MTIILINNIHFIIKVFEETSGLKINLQKSTFACINIDEHMTNIAERIWGCQASSLPFNYFGMPLGGNEKKLSFWEPVIELIERKFVSWKHEHIYKGGRLTLIKAALTNTPTYLFSTFKAPSSICKSIEKKVRDFL